MAVRKGFMNQLIVCDVVGCVVIHGGVDGRSVRDFDRSVAVGIAQNVSPLINNLIPQTSRYGA